MPYSTSFYVALLTEAVSVAYTVPDDYVAVVRDVEAYNNSGSDSNFNVEATVPGPLTGVIFHIEGLATNTWQQWQGRVVLPAGSTIAVNGSVYDWYVMISGYLLSSP